MEHQGKYPVIFMSLKSLRADPTFESAKENLAIIPKDVEQLAVILELKSLILTKPVGSKKLDAMLDKEAKKALLQIDELHYTSELQ